MIAVLLNIFGFLLARSPEGVLRFLRHGLAGLLYWGFPGKRKLAVSNLQHAFPGKPHAWHRKTAKESFRHMFEFALLSLAQPFFSEARIRTIYTLSPQTKTMLLELARERTPAVFLIPHLGPQEALTTLPLLLSPADLPPIGAIYRPFDNPAVDRWILRTRQRFGVQLLSRKEGLRKASETLRQGGWLGVLFDQNSGRHGGLITFFGRVASATQLPGLLTIHHNTTRVFIHAERRDFWKIELAAERAHARPADKEAVTIASNTRLEQLLSEDTDRIPSWLWIHNRWRTQQNPAMRLQLRRKKNSIDRQNQDLGRAAVPRNTHFWIRLPNWLGDVVMAVPLLRALRESRPDAQFTLVGKSPFLPLLEGWGLADKTVSLPQRGIGYFLEFHRLRNEFPDTYLLFTHSFRGDLEAFLTRAPQRFGMIPPGRKRPLLTHSWTIPATLEPPQLHQTFLGQRFLEHFGLNVSPDFSPLSDFSGGESRRSIGLICGTENAPEKRWPVASWRSWIRTLLEREQDLRIILFGTANDTEITSAVAQGFPLERVEDIAGKTDLQAFANRLQSCRLVVGNDTGGLHLANALGVPVIALCGPTNPVRTGPIFDAPKTILQPKGCPPTGGLPMDQIPPEDVIEAVEKGVLSAYLTGNTGRDREH